MLAKHIEGIKDIEGAEDVEGAEVTGSDWRGIATEATDCKSAVSARSRFTP